MSDIMEFANLSAAAIPRKAKELGLTEQQVADMREQAYKQAVSEGKIKETTYQPSVAEKLSKTAQGNIGQRTISGTGLTEDEQKRSQGELGENLKALAYGSLNSLLLNAPDAVVKEALKGNRESLNRWYQWKKNTEGAQLMGDVLGTLIPAGGLAKGAGKGLLGLASKEGAKGVEALAAKRAAKAAEEEIAKTAAKEGGELTAKELSQGLIRGPGPGRADWLDKWGKTLTTGATAGAAQIPRAVLREYGGDQDTDWGQALARGIPTGLALGAGGRLLGSAAGRMLKPASKAIGEGIEDVAAYAKGALPGKIGAALEKPLAKIEGGAANAIDKYVDYLTTKGASKALTQLAGRPEQYRLAGGRAEDELPKLEAEQEKPHAAALEGTIEATKDIAEGKVPQEEKTRYWNEAYVTDVNNAMWKYANRQIPPWETVKRQEAIQLGKNPDEYVATEWQKYMDKTYEATNGFDPTRMLTQYMVTDKNDAKKMLNTYRIIKQIYSLSNEELEEIKGRDPVTSMLTRFAKMPFTDKQKEAWAKTTELIRDAMGLTTPGEPETAKVEALRRHVWDTLASPKLKTREDKIRALRDIFVKPDEQLDKLVQYGLVGL